MTSNRADRLPEWGTSEHVPVAELARRQGVGPISSVDDLARPDLFESEPARAPSSQAYRRADLHRMVRECPPRSPRVLERRYSVGYSATRCPRPPDRGETPPTLANEDQPE
jgi:hypothetical protein